MKRSALFVLLLTLIFTITLVQPAFALYKWVDEKGQLHITDYPPPTKAVPEPAPEPAKPMPSPAPASVTPPVAAPSTAAPAAVPQSAQTKTAPPVTTNPSPTAAATRPSVTAIAIAKPTTTAVAAPAPAPSPAVPARPRQQPMPAPPAGLAALAGGLLIVFVLIGIAFYVYYALSMYLIAKKLNVAEAWMSWVPILNLWPFLTSAGKPCWWVVLLLIPIVNFFVIIYLWMCICENLGRNKWLGLLILVPVLNLILPGMLAFSKKE